MARLWLWLVLGAWVLAILGGQRWWLAYQYTAGEEPVDLPTTWPANSALSPTPGRPTLLLFVHPNCPCSQASVKELIWILGHNDGPLDAAVLLWCPTNAPDDWLPSSWAQRNTALPPYHLILDEGGREAGLFHVLHSGTVLLYNADGQLVYRGGITGGRGHSGDNPGRRAVLRRLQQHPADRQPIFGCPLCPRAES